MAFDQNDDFMCSGPTWLTCVDWSRAEHQRSVAASLVNGVYVLEKERQKKREGHINLSPWWTFFNFKIFQVIKDESDNSVFGVIFKFDAPNYQYDQLKPTNPTYVVAFRGTLTERQTRQRDLCLDFQIFINKLNVSSRFGDAIRITESLVGEIGVENVWLAGHSLGSAIGLLVGKNMVKKGYNIKSFLFNPPFPNAPVEQIKSKKVKLGIHIAGSVARAALANIVKGSQNIVDSDDNNHSSFFELSSWQPSLFVNEADPICSRYITYFANREEMVKLGFGSLECLATQHSFRSLLLNSVGEDSIPAHLIPSASLVASTNPPPHPIKAHGIDLWWSPNINCKIMKHLWRGEDFSRGKLLNAGS